jgi:hypothetical protein
LRETARPTRTLAVFVSAAVLSISTSLHAQVLLDRVLFKFGTEIVTLLDVRQARMLKLVDATQETDQAYVEALVNRRLMLSEVRRTASPEPGDQAVDARYAEWQRRLGATDVRALLVQAGMSEAGSRAWIRDDVRLQTYLNVRFAGRQTDLANWIVTLRQRAGIRELRIAN